MTYRCSSCCLKFLSEGTADRIVAHVFSQGIWQIAWRYMFVSWRVKDQAATQQLWLRRYRSCSGMAVPLVSILRLLSRAEFLPLVHTSALPTLSNTHTPALDAEMVQSLMPEAGQGRHDGSGVAQGTAAHVPARQALCCALCTVVSLHQFVKLKLCQRKNQNKTCRFFVCLLTDRLLVSKNQSLCKPNRTIGQHRLPRPIGITEYTKVLVDSSIMQTPYQSVLR